MTGLVRVEALQHFEALVAGLGGDAAALLRAAGIAPRALAGQGYVRFRAVVQLLEQAAAALHCPDFGLRLAARQEFGIFGPLALASQNCATLGEAVDCFIRHFHTHNQAYRMWVRPQRGGALLIGGSMLLRDPPEHHQYDERGAALLYHSLRFLTDGAFRPVRVFLPHAPLSRPAQYRALFGCPVEFRATELAVELANRDWRRPLRSHNERLRLVATSYLESLGATPAAALSTRVREAAGALLAGGRCTGANVADALNLHPRTLQRRLADAGTSFEAIRDELRRERARRYLADAALPLSQVAALLGYSEQAALTRSCRRWFRCAPLALRRQGRAGAAGNFPGGR